MSGFDNRAQLAAKLEGKSRRSHLYSRPGAKDHAKLAMKRMEVAIELLECAELQLKESGYRGASVGIRQANARVKEWKDKVEAEVGPCKS